MKPKKEKSKTLSAYNGLRVGRVALLAGSFACPVGTASIVTLINWEEWFANSGKSLPLGFACLLATVVLAILGVLKSDVVFKKADIALYCLAGFFMLIGLTCMFLASLFTQMGYMWLYTGSSLLASGACITVEKKVIEPELAFYKGLVEENALDNKTKKINARRERAKAEAMAEAKRRAVE